MHATVELPGTPALQFAAVLHVPPDEFVQLSVQTGIAALVVAVATATIPSEPNEAMAMASAAADLRTLNM